LTYIRQGKPRLCGEYIITQLDRAGIGGSTPRMRGMPTSLVSAVTELGINPAYAGNMAFPVGMDFTNVGQPRVCGEFTYQPASLRSKSLFQVRL